MEGEEPKQRGHRKKQAGPKQDKKKAKVPHEQELTAQQRNPKAFAFHSVNKVARSVRRTLDVKEKRHHIPVVDRTPVEPPPILIAVVGPPKVGKTTVINCLIRSFTRQKLTNIQGPVTIVSGKKRRLTFIECNNDINSMIDLAKVADLVLLLVDASFGFEMEIFEFLNICQVHGFPKIMGVLTHLDMFRNNKQLRKTKKKLKHRFWTEVYQGAKLFYLSGMVNGEYQKTEIHNLGRFISVIKFRPLQWRTTHPYLLADRMEDVTDPEAIRQNSKVDRSVCLYGYVRGTHMKNNSQIHIPGAGDFTIQEMSHLPDPCPLPTKERKRGLNEKERLVYAPMSGVGGIVYDKDAVYIDLGGSHSMKDQTQEQEVKPSNEIVSSLIGAQDTLDSKMAASQLSLFSDSTPITDVQNPVEEKVKDSSGRVRRKAVFAGQDIDVDQDDEDDDSEDEEDEEEEEEEEEEDSGEEEEFQVEEESTKKKAKVDLSQMSFDEDESDDDDESDDEMMIGDDESGDESNDDEEMEVDDTEKKDEESSHLKWKDNLAEKASEMFLKRQRETPNLRKLVYGDKLAKEEEEEEDTKKKKVPTATLR